MTNAVVIVAAGKGARASSAGERPKQYLTVGGKPVLLRTLEAFLAHDGVDFVVPVIDSSHQRFFEELCAGISSHPKMHSPARGGASRQASVLAGLRMLREVRPDNVLIHDAARPFISGEIISRALTSLESAPACLVAIPVSDTLKAEQDGRVARTIDRSGLWRAQTPQGFRYDIILEAHEKAENEGRADFTDDAALAEWQGHEVALVMGSERNIKLTTAEDFDLAERLMMEPRAAFETRVGSGYDVHAFEPGDAVILCGVPIPHDTKLKGHSDADVGLHALTDALLGAIGAGDIGSHFPPSDPQWSGADSSLFLRHAASLVREAGGRIVNADVTLICERPRIGPHREAMRKRIAEILDEDVSRIGVKATTTEGLGFTGRREGIAAMASVAVEFERKV
jgi:2-C-methyl-D-erythritol 4-phosphate cytidylyltransferase/2-C-methyl-D-erythritol 2,4-cyclodiphosphate synthase